MKALEYKIAKGEGAGRSYGPFVLLAAVNCRNSARAAARTVGGLDDDQPNRYGEASEKPSKGLDWLV